ncbi:MAG: hypothetical protein RLY99_840, partial [Pseudomonadota bacterium]
LIIKLDDFKDLDIGQVCVGELVFCINWRQCVRFV